MTVHLLNAAVMPDPEGVYRSESITQDEFAVRAIEAFNKGELISYIGYERTAEILSDLCGFEIRENRKETVIDDGDVLLIARIKYRLTKHFRSDEAPTLDDLEFRVVCYSKM